MDPIAPGSSAALLITLTQAGVLKDDATMIASVYAPNGALIVADEPVVFTGVSNSGQYRLDWDAAWTLDGSSNPLEGEYMAVVTATRAGSTRIRRFLVPVRHEDLD